MKKIFRNDLERSDWLLQLDGLLQEGFSLSEALTLLATYQTGKKKEWSIHVYESLLDGNDFSSQLLHAGYTREVVSSMFFSENYGNLQEGIKKGAGILKNKYDLVSKGKKLLQYPVFLIILLLVLVSILAEGVFPQFQAFFQSNNQHLPWITQLVISTVTFFQFPFLLYFLLVCFLIAACLKKTSIHNKRNILLKIPIIKDIMKTVYTYHFVSQLSPILKSGLSLFESLKLLEKNSKVAFIQSESSVLLQELRQGTPFSESVLNRGMYETQLPAMIRLGEAKGSVGDELERYGNFLMRKLYERSERVLIVMQPLIYGIIGFIVMVLFLSMMMPIFNIVDSW
ncbi:competence type IV pilus assembly protein ComGB [Evansella sp. AB-rgal1]|uniref:competence type IV pilus assembly protein ComGB n=1 Tax=Evansella sp. AB-rgal1 TaxID=3242696 RepID=UPI00359E2510